MQHSTDWYLLTTVLMQPTNLYLTTETNAVRFGGVILRLKQCIEILESYIKGKTDRIDELEQKLLDPERENYDKPHDSAQCMYVEVVSANAYTHFRP